VRVRVRVRARVRARLRMEVRVQVDLDQPVDEDLAQRGVDPCLLAHVRRRGVLQLLRRSGRA
jgi:hypothetical protein